MKRTKLIAISLLVALLLVSGVSAVKWFHRSDLNNPTVHGTVTRIDTRQNGLQKTYLMINVRGEDQQVYTIDATESLNRTDDQKDCIAVARIKKGDRVSFKLPKTDTRSATAFTSCHPRSETGYYLTIG